jgi:hypothetical protein
VAPTASFFNLLFFVVVIVSTFLLNVDRSLR